MANTYYNGKSTLLFVDVTTPITTLYTSVTTADAEMVACLDTNGFEMTNAEIDASSKCSDGNFAESIGGQQSWSMSGDGKFIIPVGTELSNNELFKLARNNGYAWFFQYDPAKNKMRYGVGHISTFSENSGNNELETFSISITGSGIVGDQDDITP